MSKGYLLDTQVLSWLEHEPGRLGVRTKRVVERSEIYYCSISLAELSFKRSLGKYSYQSDLAQRWQDTGITPLKFDDHAAHAFGRFSPEWVADPFDRQIMAVAASNDLVLVTSDRRMLAQGFDWVLDATT